METPDTSDLSKRSQETINRVPSTPASVWNCAWAAFQKCLVLHLRPLLNSRFSSCDEDRLFRYPSVEFVAMLNVKRFYVVVLRICMSYYSKILQNIMGTTISFGSKMVDFRYHREKLCKISFTKLSANRVFIITPYWDHINNQRLDQKVNNNVEIKI